MELASQGLYNKKHAMRSHYFHISIPYHRSGGDLKGTMIVRRHGKSYSGSLLFHCLSDILLEKRSSPLAVETYTNTESILQLMMVTRSQ